MGEEIALLSGRRSSDQFNIRDFLFEAFKSAGDVIASKFLSYSLDVSENTPINACGDQNRLIEVLSSLGKLAAT